MFEYETRDYEVFKIRDKRWLDKRIETLAKLSKRKKDQIRGLFAEDHQRNHLYPAENRVAACSEMMAGWSDKRRREFFDVLFPKLSPHFDRAWQLAAERPYQSHWQRFPFRAQQRSDIVDRNRARFVVFAAEALRGLDPDAEWLAAWAPHLERNWQDQHVLGWLLAAVLRSGGDDANGVRQILEDSINGRHDVGVISNQSIIALLNSPEPADWEIVGKLLLAAQRQEGLRQAILETVDESHPDAFRYMLGLIIDNDLGRFSATIRAFDTWLGMRWAAGSTRFVQETIQKLQRYFDDEELRTAAVTSGEAEETYLALWVAGFRDAETALREAKKLLYDKNTERRYAAILLIQRLRLVPDSVNSLGQQIVDAAEPDARLQMAIAECVSSNEVSDPPATFFPAFAALFEATPQKRRDSEPLIWPWAIHAIERRTVAIALRRLAQADPQQMIPYAQTLETYDCVSLINELAGIGEYWVDGTRKKHRRKKLSKDGRSLMLELIVDKRAEVQKAAFHAIDNLPVEEDEVAILIKALRRTAAKLRACAIKRLATMPTKRGLEVAEELIADRNAKRKAAGLELLQSFVESKSETEKATALVEEHYESLPDELKSVADRICAGGRETVTLDDCLGLVPVGSRSKLPVPVLRNVQYSSDAAVKCLKDLSELFLQHAKTEVEIKSEDSTKRMLLGGAGWSFPRRPNGSRDDVRDAAQQLLPLCSVWTDWIQERPDSMRDADGLELIRMCLDVWRGNNYSKRLSRDFRKDDSWELRTGFEHLIDWLIPLAEEVHGASQLFVQHAEDALAGGDPTPEEKSDLNDRDHRGSMAIIRLRMAQDFHKNFPYYAEDEKTHRLTLLSMLALECEPSVGMSDLVPIEDFALTYDAGLLNKADFFWLLLNPRRSEYGNLKWIHLGPIADVTGMRPHAALAKNHPLQNAVETLRKRLVDLESERGEMAIAASLPASKLRYAGGTDVFFQLVAALGKTKIIRQDEWGDEPTRAYSFSRLISVTSPREDDSYEQFAKLVESAPLTPDRLREFAMFAPQWAGHIGHAIAEPWLEDAVWWIHAHTKQNSYWRQEEFRDLWASRVAERSELAASDLEEGAVDVAWFQRVIKATGRDRWTQLMKSARYASNSGGHKRAELFAKAMLGEIATDALWERIESKRHQDSVRALGLVSIDGAKAKRKAETLRRYQQLQEFKRGSRKFGSQRQASESRAVEIALQNLARTAGYRDPRRLQWAMETAAVADLAKGPVEITVDETVVSLAINAEGAPQLTVIKKNRPLKDVPAKLRKHAEIAELRARVVELRRQRSRIRIALEEAMCRGDTFAATELREFDAHPILRSMIQRLVFVGDNDLIGFPDESGRVLRNVDGTIKPIGSKDALRIAHPIDFLDRGDWRDWQRECFAAERVQPFKQIFRETYPRTAAESEASSQRYAGHQVNPRQALALLKQRHWTFAPEEGVRKVFHDDNLIAEVTFQETFYTPAEIEDLAIDEISFIRRKTERYQRIRLEKIPARLFSEVMRDLDLVVSVAHSGGVDPEASASTIEMRANLVRATSQLLQLGNVSVDGHHVKIDGTRGSYSVHLGSANCHVVPGRALFIVPVHSQHRGRLFLPFADDDPKTAEVLSKTLLLARDDEIKDPSIIKQIL